MSFVWRLQLSVLYSSIFLLSPFCGIAEGINTLFSHKTVEIVGTDRLVLHAGLFAVRVRRDLIFSRRILVDSGFILQWVKYQGYTSSPAGRKQNF